MRILLFRLDSSILSKESKQCAAKKSKWPQKLNLKFEKILILHLPVTTKSLLTKLPPHRNLSIRMSAYHGESEREAFWIPIVDISSRIIP